MIRVELPYHLRKLARIGKVIELEIPDPVTQRAVIDAIELKYPMLSGTIRDHNTHRLRPFLRIYACSEDISLNSQDIPLPDKVILGEEPLLIIGAIAGG